MRDEARSCYAAPALSKAATTPEPRLSLLEHELKLVLPARRAPTLARVLGRLLRRDPHHAEGIVESIYFDTRELRLLAEKAASDYLKTKIRVRWYPWSGGDGPSFLELKRRVGTRRHKIRRESPWTAGRLSAEPLTSAELARLPQRLRPEGLAVPDHLLPVLVVRYHRRRWVDPASRARISLDTAITVPRFSRELGLTPNPAPLAHAVLEIKAAAARLPPRLAALSALGLRRASFSKYAACWSHLAPPVRFPISRPLRIEYE